MLVTSDGAIRKRVEELHAGEPVPTVYDGTWAPDESDIVDAAAAEELAYNLLDGDRWRFHLSQLERDRRLDAIARAHSEDMRDSDFIGHISRRTGAPADRLARAGYKAVYHSENIARNASLWDAQSGLFHSLGHRQNILSARATHVGVGVAVGRYNDKPIFYLTQLFGRPPVPIEPRRVARELRARLNETRVRADLEPLSDDAALAAVAVAQAALEDATPRSVLDAAQARGLTRRGASAVVSTQSELDGWQLPPSALEERYNRVGIGVHQDLDATPPRLRVVVLLGG